MAEQKTVELTQDKIDLDSIVRDIEYNLKKGMKMETKKKGRI